MCISPDPNSPPQTNYYPTITAHLNIISIKDFEFWLSRYTDAIAHLEQLSLMPLDMYFKERQAEVHDTIVEAVNIMRGLVGFLEYLMRDGGIPELDEWVWNAVGRLTKCCESGIGVMNMGIEELMWQRDLCEGLLKMGMD